MSKYVKPELRAEIIKDVNEPVYMACSGIELFTASVEREYEHQVPEEGRIDCRFQVNADVASEPVFVHEGPLYFYYLFDQPVVVDRTSDFQIISSTSTAGGGTLVIASMTYTVNQSQSIGFGDLFVRVTPDANNNVHDPEVRIAFGYNPNGCF